MSNDNRKRIIMTNLITKTLVLSLIATPKELPLALNQNRLQRNKFNYILRQALPLITYGVSRKLLEFLSKPKQRGRLLFFDSLGE